MIKMKVAKMHDQNGQHGILMYQCIHCERNFSSSQAIAGHIKIHSKNGWIKGTPQKKVFVQILNSQQQPQSSNINSSTSQQQQQQSFSAATSETHSANIHQLTPSPALSSIHRPRVPKHHLRIRDMKTLARLRARLNQEEEEVILRLLNNAREQEQNEQHGMLMYQCIYCERNFPSSQAIAGHTKAHSKNGWIKGTPQKKVFVQIFNSQQQPQSSNINSSTSLQQQQQNFAAATSETDSVNIHQLTPSPALSSRRRPWVPKHHLRIRDMKTLARLRARLNQEEEEVILRLLNNAREQEKKSSKKCTEMEVISNKNSEEIPAIGTTNNM